MFRAKHDANDRYPKYGVAVTPLNRMDVMCYEPVFGSTWILAFMSCLQRCFKFYGMGLHSLVACPGFLSRSAELGVKRGAPKLVRERQPLEGFGTIRRGLGCHFESGLRVRQLGYQQESPSVLLL